MKICILLLAAFTFTLGTRACINTTGAGTKFDGSWTVHSLGKTALALRMAIARSKSVDGLQMEAALRNSTNYNDRSDYAVALMYLGRPAEAIALLQKLEQEEPGNYFVAANLGTAYELSGNNAEAAHWIAEGIRRNPKSHEGTEWLHLKILEAKMAQEKDANYFKKHSVLDLRPENITPDSLLTEMKLSPEQVATAIQYQLEERLQFVKPPDPAVASLLFDYAAIDAAIYTLEPATQILGMAEAYGYPRDQVDPLMKLYDRRIAWRKTKQGAFYVFAGLCLAALLYGAYRRKIFVLSRRDLKPV